MKQNLADRLRESALLCDGGMGTQLLARGLRAGESAERWNTERPADVAAVHRAYLEAGCALITTNTFQGTSSALSHAGLGAEARALNEAGARLAREAVDDWLARGQHSAWALGDVGPCGLMLEPLGEATEVQLGQLFTEQIEALRAGGADGVIVETMSDPSELAVAVRSARAVADWPVIATFAFGRGAAAGEFRTMMGTTVGEAVRAAVEAGADAVGANCGTALALADYRRLAAQLLEMAGDVPVIVQPNAGAPRMVDGSTSYEATPEQMAELAALLRSAGVRLIGGCCGTTPQHLRAVARVVNVD